MMFESMLDNNAVRINGNDHEAHPNMSSLMPAYLEQAIPLRLLRDLMNASIKKAPEFTTHLHALQSICVENASKDLVVEDHSSKKSQIRSLWYLCVTISLTMFLDK